MVSEFDGGFCFFDGLLSSAAYAGDERDRFVWFPGICGGHHIFQNRLIEVDTWVPYFELGRMHTYRQAACAGVDVVTCECCHPPFIELPLTV